MTLRDRVGDAVDRLRGDGPTICYACQTPIGDGEAVSHAGEVFHRDCARGLQQVGIAVSRTDGGEGR